MVRLANGVEIESCMMDVCLSLGQPPPHSKGLVLWGSSEPRALAGGKLCGPLRVDGALVTETQG